MTVHKQESSEVRDSILKQEDDRYVRFRANRDTAARQGSKSPYRIRDPSPKVNPKYLTDEEGFNPLQAPAELSRLSMLPSKNKQK